MRRTLALSLIVLATSTACVVVVPDKRRHGDGGGSSQDAGRPSHDAGPSHDDHDAGGPRPGMSRRRYQHLPNLGPARAYFNRLGTQAQVDRGYLTGSVTLSGAGFYRVGQGRGDTVIDGHVWIKGNNWILKNMTIVGNVTINGDNNDVSDCEVYGRIDVRGTGNRTP